MRTGRRRRVGRGGRVVGLVAAALAGITAAAGAPPAVAAGEAPGAPGISAAWTTGAKNGVGTSTTTDSKVWHTLGQGVLNEVYYPQLDVPNVQDMQYVVSDGENFTELERDATEQRIELPDSRSLRYRQINTDADGRYRITKTYVTDPQRSVLMVRTRFEVLRGGPLQLYALYNPSLNGSGMGDTGATSQGSLVASDGEVSSALASSVGFDAATSGYSGTSSDGYQDLSADHRLDREYTEAADPGNLVQTARIPVEKDTTFTLTLGFGPDRSAAKAATTAALDRTYEAARAEYDSGWHDYLSSLRETPESVTSRGLTTQYNVAAMTLKSQEDKTRRGAFVASTSIPWGGAKNADECCTPGYHLVWSRDLYHTATAALALGDRAAADRALDYLLNVQWNEDGSFPQNTWLDGEPHWQSLQLDEVAYPIVLAHELGRTGDAEWAKLKKSADFIVENGPSTPQERWEEEGGYSPSTIAAEIAGLVTAADMARQHGDEQSAQRYLDTADEWQRKVDDWTFTTSGPHGDGAYYQRIDDDGNPNNGNELCLNNGGGCHDERAIIDAGFLDLVRLGVKPADAPAVRDSLAETDAQLRVRTPNGPGWYRYNHDGYGEKAGGDPYAGEGVGRLWPLLTGERGEYELAAGGSASKHLETMARMANEGHLIPEQVWDRESGNGFVFGEGTGSATPLAWSMSQFIQLARNMDAGENVETPDVVAERYAR
ncbi:MULTISPECIES: glucan 1,4-alpha-glucosidase [Actinopolyspora]|uniref:Glucoamylase n=1 Tax=Actinopolyspora saharensis TaxID=995062 RepID=A0A1H0XUX0_9ACTN|nr:MULTISPECIES: glucan 1,4-alpha-glucosidase [Actinopolyspora]NHD17342.1 glucan 1,4-alpha-glucosidase [Actinopolyspora sp. BKK2]NHE76925.1 glucan 1,4-alpha-glucosidase [Actinopolyspora sp. BKK1]SDQ06673.1 glucoamylase [Actinopolyspora saharensis]